MSSGNGVMLRKLRQVPEYLEYYRVYRKYRALTMVRPREYVDSMLLARSYAERIEGDIVECGTWRGGVACGLIEVTGGNREYHFFDSFEGLPKATEKDGESAIAYQADTASPKYFDNCAADEAAFRDAIAPMAAPERLHVYRGWFSDTMKLFPRDRRIAVLRLDGDWFDSTLQCLEGLYDRVTPGGVIIVDDYYAWDGCARAVHHFLAARSLPDRIHQSALGRVAYLVKSLPTHEPEAS
jgi:O-methyltransferase